MAENAAGAVIGTLTVTDPDAGDSHGLAVSDTRFEVVGGVLRLKVAWRSTTRRRDSVEVTVTATDAGAGVDQRDLRHRRHRCERDADRDRALRRDGGGERRRRGDRHAHGDRPDAGDSHGLAVSDTRFEVVGGVLRLKDGVALDHEAADSVEVTVTATDAAGCRSARPSTSPSPM